MVNSVFGVWIVFWLMFDCEKLVFLIGLEYGKYVVGRVKEMLLVMEKEGKLIVGDGGIYKF